MMTQQHRSEDLDNLFRQFRQSKTRITHACQKNCTPSGFRGVNRLEANVDTEQLHS